MTKPYMSPEKAEAWHSLLSSPLLAEMMATAGDTLDEIRYRVIVGASKAPPTPKPPPPMGPPVTWRKPQK